MASACAVLSACMTPTIAADDHPTLPTSQFPLRTQTETAGFALAPHDYGLSTPQADALRDLVTEWRASGDGVILVEAPSCACDDAAATAFDTRDALVAFGAPANAVRLIGYDAGPGAPIRVSFQKLAAQIYNCGTAWGDLTKSGSNEPDDNFGCSVNSNIAAMIDNPADIQRPRAADPVSATRRQVVIQRYTAGEATTSEPNNGDRAVLSNVGQ